MKEIIREYVRKLMHFLIFYPIYYLIWFNLFGNNLLEDPFLILVIVIFFGINLIDILIRPMSDSNELRDKYTLVVLLFFLFGPLILVLAFYENNLIISNYLPIYNNPFIGYIGVVGMIVGSIVMLSSRYQLNKHSYGGGSLSEEKEQTLLTDGMYKIIRHPIYAGGLIVTIGLELAFRSLIVLSIHTVIFLMIFRERMKQEETVLLTKYGEEYRVYMESTYRLIPYLY
ncbi:MAG: methyltransferase family protein [Candidatus Hodarchaeota archaeon]